MRASMLAISSWANSFHETEVFLGSACQLTLVCVILGKFVVFALIGNDRRIAHLGFKFAISGNDLLELFAHFTLC